MERTCDPVEAQFPSVDLEAVLVTCHRCGRSFDFADDGEGRDGHVYCQPCAEGLYFRCHACDNDFSFDDQDEATGYCRDCAEAL